MKTLIGYLRAVSDGGYFMECQDGTLEIVYMAEGIPANKLIALCVNYGGLISVQEPRYSLLAEDPAEESNYKRWAFFRVVPYGSSDEIKAKWQKLVDEMAQEFEWYWTFHNRNWVVECRGYVIEFEGVTGSPYYLRKETDAFYKAGSCGDFHPTHWMIWGGTGGKCGTAILGGNRGVVYDNVGCGIRTSIHEGGHNFNLHHSGSIDEVGGVSEYGDPLDIMGGSVFVGFVSPHYLQMNLDTGREIKVIDRTQQVFLVPVENLWHSMHENCWQHGLVKRQGLPTLHLSLKKGKGYKYSRTAANGDRLYIHIMESDNKTKMLGEYMMPGDERTFDGTIIRYLEYNRTMEIARVNVRLPDGHRIDENLMPSGLPQDIPTAELDESYNGTWHDARFPGQGLNVCIKNGVVAVYWFTFDKEGNPAYLFGACDIKDGVETMILYQTKGGTFDDPTTYTEAGVGIAQVYFYGHTKDEKGNDTTRGVFVYQCSDYGNGSIEITPAGPLTTDPRNGVRFDPTKIGSGFAIQYYNQMMNEQGELEDRISMSWYTYDYGYKQLWFSCEGKLNLNNSVYSLKIYEVLKGEFGYFSDVEFKHVGLALWNPTAHEFRYELDSNKVKSDGTMTLSEEAF